MSHFIQRWQFYTADGQQYVGEGADRAEAFAEVQRRFGVTAESVERALPLDQRPPGVRRGGLSA